MLFLHSKMWWGSERGTPFSFNIQKYWIWQFWTTKDLCFRPYSSPRNGNFNLLVRIKFLNLLLYNSKSKSENWLVRTKISQCWAGEPMLTVRTVTHLSNFSSGSQKSSSLLFHSRLSSICMSTFYTPVSRRAVLCDWVWLAMGSGRASTQVSAR